MGNSNKKFWELFERLAYEYVSNVYKKNILEKEQTISSHDHGYDGIWVIQLEESLQKIIMEAKYRKSQVSLPLSDCAKAIIIAFNLNVDKLYIATNIMFAPQAKKEIVKFQSRSSLTIFCITKVNLKRFIEENREYLLKIDILNESFLDEISNSVEEESDNFIEESIDNEVEEFVQDEKRRKLINELSVSFQMSNACLMLTGNEGVGKSVIGRMVCDDLSIKGFDNFKIDLSVCTSSRILYLKVLEGIWGVSLTTILEDESIHSYIDTIIDVEKTMDKGISEAIKHILTSSYSEYKQHEDKYLYLLIQYVDEIMLKKKSNFKLLLIFENIHMAFKEVISFLIELVKCFKGNSIRVLLEVRSPFFLEYDIETHYSNVLFSQLEQISDRQLLLEAIDQDIAASLLEEKLKFKHSACVSLATILGDNFLEMQGAIQVLKHIPQAEIDELEFCDVFTKSRFEEYWDSLGISSNSVIYSLIKNLRKNADINSILELAYVFEGVIPYDILEALYHDKTSVIIKLSINSTIFKGDYDAITCKHLRYMKAIQMTEDLYIRHKLAIVLLPILQQKKNANPRFPFVELKILHVLKRNKEIPSCVLHVMNLYMESFQFNQALHIAFSFIKSQEHLVLSFDEDVLFILMKALSCIRELHEENNKKYEYLYEKTYTYITCGNKDNLYNNFLYLYQLAIWHKEFVAGKFEKAYEISQLIYKEINKTSFLLDEKADYIGQVYNAHGLSIKMKYGGEAAETFFAKGLERYPNSYYLKAAFLSQTGNRLLKIDPFEAALKYDELIQTVKGKEYPFQEVLHTRIDKAMAYFLAGKFNDSIVCSRECKEIALTMGIHAQAGRLLNIHGCCIAATSSGNFDECIEIFKLSIYSLELAKAKIYEWRTQLNLASCLLQSNKKDEALEKIECVTECLLMNFIAKIKVDKHSVPYQSLLLILMYLHEEKHLILIDKILIKVNEIKSDYLFLSKDKKWKLHFHEKVICFNDIVLVTG